MTNTSAPFRCSYTSTFPQLLAELECSLLISTASTGKIIVLSAGADGHLIQLARSFAMPMRMAVQDQRIAIATHEAIVVLGNAAALAPTYPRQPNTYDALFVPRAMYFTGALGLHDLAWGSDGLWAVSAQLSSLGLLDAQHSFTPLWTPPFITANTPGDRCHLNGLELVDGQPRFVTALSATDEDTGWRNHGSCQGVLLDVPAGEPILQGLMTPQSPRVYADRLFLLLSARSELVAVDTARGTYETIARLSGFLRGMTRCGDYLFIGAAPLPDPHGWTDLPSGGQEPFSGVFAVHLPSGAIAGSIRYPSGREQIYDVQPLPGLRRPNVLAPDSPHALEGVVLPSAAYWLTSAAQRTN